MAQEIHIDKDLLYKKYIIEEKSIRDISKDLQLTIFIVHKNLKKFKLNRSTSKAQKIAIKNGKNKNLNPGKIINKKILIDLYINKKLRICDVAKIMNHSEFFIWSNLKRLGISRNVSESQIGRNAWNKGKKQTEDVKQKISDKKMGQVGPWLGKKRSMEDRRKMRIGALNRLKNRFGQIHPNYNPKACKAIDDYGKKYGYCFQHAENGGEFYIKELGYWVDGYDKEKNTVLEFDEKHHYRFKDKDMVRQNEIIEHLNCAFIRLNDHGQEILKLI